MDSEFDATLMKMIGIFFVNDCDNVDMKQSISMLNDEVAITVVLLILLLTGDEDGNA